MARSRRPPARSPFRVLPLLLLPLLLPATARSGEAVGYREALARALRSNPYVAAASLEAEAASREAGVARGRYLPTVTAGERYSRTSAPAEVFGLKMNQQALSPSDFADVDRFNDPPPRSGFTGTLVLEQPVFAPRAFLGARMAGREARAATKDLARRKEEILHDTLGAWLAVLSAKEYAAVAEGALSDAREHLRAARLSEEAGLGLASDVLRAQVFVARAEGDLVSASTRLDLARRALALAAGEGAGASLDAAGELPSFPPPGTAEERIASARANRADLAALSGRVENAKAAVELERSDYLPTLGFQAGYQLDHESSPLSTDHGSWKAGLALSWTVFDGFRREGSAARASAAAARAKEHRRGADDRAAYEVSAAWLALAGSEKRLAIASAAAEAAAEGARLVKSRYENHLARMVDLLDAQTALDGARADRARAENDLRRAQAALEFATGTLLAWSRGEGAAPGKGPTDSAPGDETARGGTR